MYADFYAQSGAGYTAEFPSNFLESAANNAWSVFNTIYDATPPQWSSIIAAITRRAYICASLVPESDASMRSRLWLRSTGRRYIIGAPKSELKKFAFALATSAYR